MDFFEDPPTPKPLSAVRLAEIMPRDEPTDGLRLVEDKVLGKSLEIVRDALCFVDIDMGSEEMPVEWIDEVGPEAARRRQRAAQWAQLNAKEAPVGLKLAKEVLIGIVKARAVERAEPKRLNIQVTKIDFQLPEFPRVAVDR